MTYAQDQKRARAERVIREAMLSSGVNSNPAVYAERIDAIYSEGVEPVAWIPGTKQFAVGTTGDVSVMTCSAACSSCGYRHSAPRYVNGKHVGFRCANPSCLDPVVPSPSESRLRKALEEIARINKPMGFLSTCKESYRIARRALSDTQEEG